MSSSRPAARAKRPVLAGAALLAGLATAAPLLAQSRPASGASAAALGGEIFFAHDASFPTSRLLAGGALTLGAGPLALRGSGAFNRVTGDATDVSGGATTETPWTLDADVMLGSGALGQMAGILLGGFAPVGFVGVGKEGIQRSYGSAASVSTWSWGGGASIPLWEGIRLGAEARWRTPFGRSTSASAADAGFRAGREVKLGIRFGFGAAGGRGGASSRGASGGAGRGATFPSAPASASARRVLDTADDYVGVPYVWGGETPRGFDCSGFVRYVFGRQGVRLPRVSRDQARVGEAVAADAWALRPGDLMFFAFADGRTIDHVGIYAGDGRMIHSSSSGDGVNFDDLSSRRGQFFLDHMVAARRMLADGRSLVNALDEAYRRSAPYDPPDRAPRRQR